MNSSCRGVGLPRCVTHHNDALLVQQDGVDGLLGLDVHHGLIVLLGVLRVNGGRHCVWSIWIRGDRVQWVLVVERRGLERAEIKCGRKLSQFDCWATLWSGL